MTGASGSTLDERSSAKICAFVPGVAKETVDVFDSETVRYGPSSVARARKAIRVVRPTVMLYSRAGSVGRVALFPMIDRSENGVRTSHDVATSVGDTEPWHSRAAASGPVLPGASERR
jgi:hypothetical protein